MRRNSLVRAILHRSRLLVAGLAFVLYTDPAGGDCHDADTPALAGNGHCLGERENTALRRGVAFAVGIGLMRAERRDVDDAAALVELVFAVEVEWQFGELFCALEIVGAVDGFFLAVWALHEWDCGLGHVEWCAQVGVDVCLPLLCGGEIFHSAVACIEEASCDAGIIDYDINASAEEFCGFGDSGANLFRVAEVSDGVADARSVRSEVLLNAVFGLLFVEVDDKELVLLGLREQVACCAASNASRTACDDNVLAPCGNHFAVLRFVLELQMATWK